ncbi:trace amine-associated receptor 13c-like [Salarias fasciatus]|uniref:Trace amine-associated receptor 13c-like n=1 Tax=Salarias fasciatus TaxID=181472 RepID=A0A672JCG1_SALFA|nr:trace amine-associated receptor 13c-like [Salarias fasciatus]
MEVQDGADLCFPLLHNSSCRKPAAHWSEGVLLNAVLSLVSTATAALNLLVIISVSHFRQLQTPTNNLLLSLAASDFLVGLLSMPVAIYKQSSCWALGDLLCSLYNYVSYIATSASVGHMVFISADRYVAICDPLRYPSRVTVARVRVCVCACWLCSVLHCAYILMEDLAEPGRHHLCSGECVIIINYVAGTVDLVVTFVAPIAAIFVLYSRVFVVAVVQARAVRSHVHAVRARLTAKRSELKAARTLGVLVVVFLMCFCPYYCVFLVGGDLLNASSEFYLLFLLYFNSCVNPLIYALFYPWFRKATRIIVTLQILRDRSSEANVL